MTVLLRRILFVGLLAGFVAGIAVTAVQQIQVIPLILAAEVFEGVGDATAEVHGHTHAEAHAAGAAHDHDHGDGWAPADGFERAAFTLLANILAGIGYGAVLVAAMIFAGRSLDWRRGLLWGLAGFAAFALAPAMGLPPELPGMAAADLAGRQLWWIGTAAATIGGLALVVFAPSKSAALRSAAQIAGVVLIALPHLIGAPHHAAEAGAVPAELAARFAVASLIAQAAFWAVLSAVAGHALGRALPALAATPRPAAA